MNKDKITGYVQAMIDNYYEKLKDEEDEVSKLELSVMLQDLGNLRKFIEDEPVSVTLINPELDFMTLAKAIYRDIEENKVNKHEIDKCKKCEECK